MVFKKITHLLGQMFSCKKTTSENTQAIYQVIRGELNKAQINIPDHNIRIAGNRVKIYHAYGDQTDQFDILNDKIIPFLKKQYPSFEFVLIEDRQSPVSQSKSPTDKAKKTMPHAVKGIIRPKNLKHIIAVASGKGGVGKSSISLNLARSFQRSGLKTALIDADIHGPSVPVMTGGIVKAAYDAHKLTPVMRDGIKTMSIGYMVDPAKPIVWRGPMISGAIAQMLQETDWGDIDIAIIDMPPGTGDAQLTICQNVQPDGVIIVSQPQMVSIIDAERCAMMFKSLNIPIYGVIENMSGFIAPDTQKKYYIFGQGGAEAFAKSADFPFLGALPIVPSVAYASDQGLNPFDIKECYDFTSVLNKITDNIVTHHGIKG